MEFRDEAGYKRHKKKECDEHIICISQTRRESRRRLGRTAHSCRWGEATGSLKCEDNNNVVTWSLSCDHGLDFGALGNNNNEYTSNRNIPIHSIKCWYRYQAAGIFFHVFLQNGNLIRRVGRSYGTPFFPDFPLFDCQEKQEKRRKNRKNFQTLGGYLTGQNIWNASHPNIMFGKNIENFENTKNCTKKTSWNLDKRSPSIRTRIRLRLRPATTVKASAAAAITTTTAITNNNSNSNNSNSNSNSNSNNNKNNKNNSNSSNNKNNKNNNSKLFQGCVQTGRGFGDSLAFMSPVFLLSLPMEYSGDAKPPKTPGRFHEDASV